MGGEGEGGIGGSEGGGQGRAHHPRVGARVVHLHLQPLLLDVHEVADEVDASGHDEARIEIRE